MDCARGKSGSVVEWTWMEEAPDADRICLSVTANEKISMGCAGSSILASYHITAMAEKPGSVLPLSAEPHERYCFDWTQVLC